MTLENKFTEIYSKEKKRDFEKDRKTKNIEKLEKIKADYQSIFEKHQFLETELENLMEADLESFEHTCRVADYAEMTGFEFLNETSREYLIGGALAHDIGKSDQNISPLVTKKGRLTKEEFKIFQKHPQIAWDICQKNGADIIGDIVIRSHEHQKENPYPRSGNDRRASFRYSPSDRRKENEVADKLSRILAIVDIFDALISKRHYKEAIELERVIPILKNNFSREGDELIIDFIAEKYKNDSRENIKLQKVV